MLDLQIVFFVVDCLRNYSIEIGENEESMKRYYRKNQKLGAKDRLLRFVTSTRGKSFGIVLSLAVLVFVASSLFSTKRCATPNSSLCLEVDVPKQQRALAYIKEVEKDRTLFTRAEERIGVDLEPSVAMIEAADLVINGKKIAIFQDEKIANKMLDYFRFRYVDESSEVVDVSFVQNVEIVPSEYKVVDFKGFDNPEHIKEIISVGNIEQRQHEVVSGESYWLIAQNYGIEIEDIEAANPGLDMSSLLPGQKLNLVAPAPMLTVRTSEKITYTEELEYGVVYEDTSSLYIGESKLKSSGVYGEVVVQAELQKENGVVVNKTILSEEEVSAPIDKVVYRGTMDPPPRMGTGVLGYPLGSYGIVTSEFMDTSYWRGSPHRGIDVACPVGTSVVAADGGVVIASSWAGSYGYRVIIDHGANVSTLYAHCNSLLVNVGDQVYKGQTIAYSGATGRVTGPHLHFEVRLNGNYQNPRNYVNF